MSDEKMQILRMLEQGTISADEAARLLQTLGSDTGYSGGGTNREQHSRGYEQSSRTQGGQSQQTSGHSGSGRTGFDDLASDLQRIAKDLEPKIQRFVGTVADKTAHVAQKISQKIDESELHARATHHSSPRQSAQSQASPPPPPRPRASSPSHASASRDFELRVDPGYNEINLSAFNGDLTVTGYNGDKLTVKVYVREARAGARLELMRMGSRYSLNYNVSEFKSVSIDALVPEKLFSSVILGSSNGRTNVSNITSEHFTVQSLNGDAAFRGIHSENIKIDSSNGRLSFDEISAKNAHIEGSGGAINANYLDAANLRIFTSNGAVTLNAGDFRQGADYTWVVETSNDKISFNVPSSHMNGYHIKASAPLGSINFGLPSLNYLSNTPIRTEAVSAGFDSAAVRVKITAETSNADLSVN